MQEEDEDKRRRKKKKKKEKKKADADKKDISVQLPPAEDNPPSQRSKNLIKLTQQTWPMLIDEQNEERMKVIQHC